MYELKFDPGLCEKCTTLDCIMNCQYISMDMDEARAERMKIVRGEDSRILHECVTCYACEEYCPRGNHPFYHMVELQEKLKIDPVPRPITKSQVVAMAPTGKIKIRAGKGPVVNLCFFPMLSGMLRGSLFNDASYFAGSDYMCQVMFLHFARDSVMKERIPAMIDDIYNRYIAGRDNREMVCYHDECYGAYTSWAPAHGMPVPFTPVHLFSYLRDRLLERRNDIGRLNIRAAYQRPCSNRLVPETDALVDEIFDLIGVERAERTYDRRNALCCAAVLEAQQRFEQAEDVRSRNITDMKKSGATHVVFNCPMCMYTLAGRVMENGMAPTLVSELCKKTIGE